MIYGYDLYSCVIPGDDQIENSCHTSGTEAHYRREPTWRRELRQTKPSRPLRLPTQWQNLIQMHIFGPTPPRDSLLMQLSVKNTAATENQIRSAKILIGLFYLVTATEEDFGEHLFNDLQCRV